MKLLLDTHAFIWWNARSSDLSRRAFSLCSDRNNTILLSVVSAWEIQIKQQLGKIQMDTTLEEMISHQRSVNQIQILPVTLDHIFALDDLPNHHKDPFDRLLIAQAISEDAIIISRDSMFVNYPVPVEW